MSIGRRAEWISPFLGRRSPIYKGDDLGYALNNGPAYYQDWGVGGARKRKRRAKKSLEDVIIERMSKAKKKRAVKRYIEAPVKRQIRARNQLLAELSRKARGGARRKRKNVSSPWVRHVKSYARQHGLTYGEALSKARASYYR